MGNNQYEISIIETDVDWEDVKKIRQQVFMVEDTETYEQCWDGNDFSAATQIVAKVNGVVAGGMRLRVVNMADGGTMAWEKMAIAKESRGSITLLNKLADFADHVTEMKGCRRVVQRSTTNDQFDIGNGGGLQRLVKNQPFTPIDNFNPCTEFGMCPFPKE